MVSKEYSGDRVQNGVFGAMMEVELVNDGPVTIQIDSAEARAGQQRHQEQLCNAVLFAIGFKPAKPQKFASKLKLEDSIPLVEQEERSAALASPEICLASAAGES